MKLKLSFDLDLGDDWFREAVWLYQHPDEDHDCERYNRFLNGLIVNKFEVVADAVIEAAGLNEDDPYANMHFGLDCLNCPWCLARDPAHDKYGSCAEYRASWEGLSEDQRLTKSLEEHAIFFDLNDEPKYEPTVEEAFLGTTPPSPITILSRPAGSGWRWQ